jgi:hypothetical protein
MYETSLWIFGPGLRAFIGLDEEDMETKRNQNLGQACDCVILERAIQPEVRFGSPAALNTTTPLFLNRSNSIAIACGGATKTFALNQLLTRNVSSKTWALQIR